MNLKNWDPNKDIKLYIDKVEMAFNSKITINDHTSNFSSITFNDVIPKNKLNYKDIIKVWNYADEFQLGEVYSGDKLIFFGVVNATGRLSLFPNQPKTKSIQIMDFRKWLSLKKPVELLFFKTSPERIVVDLIKKLNEPRIKVGKLDFTNNENINAYSTFGKTPYQVLKEIVAKQTDSLLYFEITENKEITINFKSETTLRNEPKIEINLENIDVLRDYKILDVVLETNIDNYANTINYESENIVTNVLKQETINITGSENITLFDNVGKISKNPDDIYLKKGDDKKRVVVLNNDRYQDGKYYDVLYTTGKNTLKINKSYLNQGWSLMFAYYPKVKNSVQLSNNEEINKIASRSQTAGDVYKYEKYNDISDLSDLLRLCKGDLNVSSSSEKIITITCERPLFNVGETCTIFSNNENIKGLYLIIEANVEFLGFNNNFSDVVFTYTLKNSKNTNTLINQFDNQSYKKNPAIDDDSIFQTNANVDAEVVINIETTTEKGDASLDAILIEN